MELIRLLPRKMNCCTYCSTSKTVHPRCRQVPGSQRHTGQKSLRRSGILSPNCRPKSRVRQAPRVEYASTSGRHSDGLFEFHLRRGRPDHRSEEHTSELQSPMYLVCRLLLEKRK